MSEGTKSVDVLGIAPYGEAAKVVVEKSLETAQQFFSAVCQPAAAEVGLLLRDTVRAWRAKNIASIANKARGLVEIRNDGVQLRAHPRIIAEVIEHGSLCEDDELQSMWAGLVASACTSDGTDEGNILFTNLLKQLTAIEARFLKCTCERLGASKWPGTGVGMTHEELAVTWGTSDREVVEYYIGHMRALGLVMSPPPEDYRFALLGKCDVTPEQLGLYLYVRCSGIRKSPAEHFGWEKIPSKVW